MPQKLTHSQSYSVRPKKEIKNDSFDESSYFSMIKLDLKRITSRIIIIREKHIQKTQFIRAPADVVISTVSNVESYSSFVPFCKKSSFDKISGIGTLQELIKNISWFFEKNFLKKKIENFLSFEKGWIWTNKTKLEKSSSNS